MLKQAPELFRQRYVVHARRNNKIALGKQVCLDFSSNDYLCLAGHPDVTKAFIDAVNCYGVGSTSSALVSGYSRAHQLLEENFAAFVGREKALLFNSGYVANLGTLSVMANRHSTVFADKLCHASLIDGIKLSGAKLLRYKHNDLLGLEYLLTKKPMSERVIVTESVFSMEGRISSIDKLVKLANKYEAMLIVDDAHGIGVLGKEGKGICEYYKLTQDELPCLVTPLGKAFASCGALVSGSADLIENLVQLAKTYRYTTALPPAIASAVNASLQVLQKELWRREKLESLIQFFNAYARALSLKIISNDLTPIKSILVRCNVLALKIKEKLLQEGIFVACIRPPTVPVNSARIRISLNCMHTEKDIRRLLHFIADELSAQALYA